MASSSLSPSNNNKNNNNNNNIKKLLVRAVRDGDIDEVKLLLSQINNNTNNDISWKQPDMVSELLYIRSSTVLY